MSRARHACDGAPWASPTLRTSSEASMTRSRTRSHQCPAASRWPKHSASGRHRYVPRSLFRALWQSRARRPARDDLPMLISALSGAGVRFERGGRRNQLRGKDRQCPLQHVHRCRPCVSAPQHASRPDARAHAPSSSGGLSQSDALRLASTLTPFPWRLAGIVLVFVCLGVSGWNEYRNVAEMKTLSAGRESFSQATCAINSELDKKLVHASCDVKNVSHLGQQIDGLRFKSADEMRGLSLRSTVEVYAWIESVSKSHQHFRATGASNTNPSVLARPWRADGRSVRLAEASASESLPSPGEKKSTNSVGGGDTVVSRRGEGA